MLFVGTKSFADEIIKNDAIESNNFFVNHRWLGGCLTNFSTIKKSVTTLNRLDEYAGEDNSYPV